MNRREFIRSALVLPIASSAAAGLSFAQEKTSGNSERQPASKGIVPAGLNPKITGIPCLRCKKIHLTTSGVADVGKGCPDCLALGFPANVTFSYSRGAKAFGGKGEGLTQYRDRLPLLDFPTLGESNTPLLPMSALAQKLGLSALFAKDESRGPTGSHKDRMSGLVVARAAQLNRPGVVAASSGNGAHSLAAYAGSVGVPCLILTTKKLSGPWKQAIEATGATIQFTNTSEERWVLMQQKVEKEGWYPVTNFISPPIGSNPFGVQGCKTIAYEIAEQLGGTPVDAVVVPTCRGDLLWGLYEGFVEAREAKKITKVPRLYAVEPLSRLERILAGEDYRTKFPQVEHPMVSIGGVTSAYQALSGVTLSTGGACSVTTQETMRARAELATQGLYLELSSAAALAGLYSLVERKSIRKGERAVIICTSHGYKELQQPT